jgi:hypothetical protein
MPLKHYKKPSLVCCNTHWLRILKHYVSYIFKSPYYCHVTKTKKFHRVIFIISSFSLWVFRFSQQRSWGPCSSGTLHRWWLVTNVLGTLCTTSHPAIQHNIPEEWTSQVVPKCLNRYFQSLVGSITQQSMGLGNYCNLIMKHNTLKTHKTVNITDWT